MIYMLLYTHLILNKILHPVIDIHITLLSTSTRDLYTSIINLLPLGLINFMYINE
jgi:hypothetical protein